MKLEQEGDSKKIQPYNCINETGTRGGLKKDIVEATNILASHLSCTGVKKLLVLGESAVLSD